ncbi:hypothetical protein EV06_1385 [Prochlorococcus sp. MIT 0602]|nr:hypothetical protein EV06_1385 [Prochlorococcus sp. MIT 0602]
MSWPSFCLTNITLIEKSLLYLTILNIKRGVIPKWTKTKPN